MTIGRVATIALWLVVPYIVGCLISIYILPEGSLEELLAPLLGWKTEGSVNGTGRSLLIKNNLNENGDVASPSVSTLCQKRLYRLLGLSPDEDNPFQSISLLMHRNGEPDACGTARSLSRGGFVQELLVHYSIMASPGGESCPPSLDKYEVESLLTQTFQGMVQSCPSLEENAKRNGGLLGYCDMGPARTPILLDHHDLVPVISTDGSTTLPCRFHTREGLRITELKQLTDLVQTQSTIAATECTVEEASGRQTCNEESMQRHLYAVPAGRVFMFAPRRVGEIFHLPHVEGANGELIYLEVLSLQPRVFDVFNFFSRDESDELVAKAINETRESHKIKRSSTGASGYNLNSRRTSESGFDTHGKTAVKVKKRCFKALGFDEYWESHGDGLQILRYNVSKAYNSHLDWIEDKSGELEHDFDSGGTGGNRFATILMYMSDLGPMDGGETVFPKGWPPHLAVSERLSKKAALEQLRASEQGNILEKGSWEEDLVAMCRTRLSVRPHSSRAVLFYSQLPNGEVDPASLHGACPVLSSQKYAANLWVWNTPRQGYPGAPIKEKFRQDEQIVTKAPATTFKQLSAQFKNSGSDPSMTNAELFYQDQYWGKLGPNDPPLGVNTFEGHEWNVKVDGKVVKSWTIEEHNGEKQTFTI